MMGVCGHCREELTSGLCYHCSDIRPDRDRWIDVSDIMPSLEKDVLVFAMDAGGGRQYVGWCLTGEKGGYEWVQGHYEQEIHNVTHWQTLPPKPAGVGI